MGSYGRLKRQKRGIFPPFWVKIQTQFLDQLWWDFLTSCKRTIFWRFPKQISALIDKWFWSYSCLCYQKGVYLPVLGWKIKLNFLSYFDGIFLHHVKELGFFDDSKTSLSPNRSSVLKLLPFHVAEKEYICSFFIKIRTQFSEHL
jgi:hypothetical protein